MRIGSKTVSRENELAGKGGIIPAEEAGDRHGERR
jgi:hypothetical protein